MAWVPFGWHAGIVSLPILGNELAAIQQPYLAIQLASRCRAREMLAIGLHAMCLDREHKDSVWVATWSKVGEDFRDWLNQLRVGQEADKLSLPALADGLAAEAPPAGQAGQLNPKEVIPEGIEVATVGQDGQAEAAATLEAPDQAAEPEQSPTATLAEESVEDKEKA